MHHPFKQANLKVSTPNISQSRLLCASSHVPLGVPRKLWKPPSLACVRVRGVVVAASEGTCESERDPGALNVALGERSELTPTLVLSASLGFFSLDYFIPLLSTRNASPSRLGQIKVLLLH